MRRAAQIPAAVGRSGHVGEALHGLGEIGNGLVGVAVFDTVSDAVFDMAFQYDLAGFVQGRFGGVDLGKNVLAGDVFIDHTVYGLYLADDFFQASVQVFRIHALSHVVNLLVSKTIYPYGYSLVSIIMGCNRGIVKKERVFYNERECGC